MTQTARLSSLTASVTDRMIPEKTLIPSSSPSQRLHGLDSTDRHYVVAAAQALDAGRVIEAHHNLSLVKASQLDHPEILRMRAGILSMSGQHQNGVQIMRRALELRPNDAVYHSTLGTLLGNAGDFDEAIVALRRCCDLQPGFAIAWYNLGLMLTRCVRNDEAMTALQRAVSLAPDHAAARALLADMLRTAGEVEQAAVEYRKLLMEQPNTGMAWWGLADLRTIHFTQNDIMNMQRALQQPGSNNDDLIATGFALAKALDETENYAESLAILERANAIALRQKLWNSSTFSNGITAALSAFTPSPSGAADETLGQEVIFIVSLPRSGSTLVEQILASHSSVEGAGELFDLPLVLAEESRRRSMPFPQWVTAMLPTDWARLGQRYMERTAHWRQQRSMFTDKLPNNWMYVGAIRAMLPAARIIVCRRDPLETCFSCYRQHLANNEYTRTFDDLASFWRDFVRSTRYWGDLYPSRVFEHNYENLLSHPEKFICQLLDFCGLPFESSCLQFHETRRTVRSPSATQVRQPLRRDTLHTIRYGKLLDPLRAALGLPLWVDTPVMRP